MSGIIKSIRGIILGKALDLAGQRFGRLTVIEKTHNAKGKLQWHCICDCGGESFVESNRLLKGITTSCGCLRKERWREAQDKISAEAKNKIKYDIIGKRFDKLTVLSNIDGTDKYECQCDCGNKVVRSRHTLLYGVVNEHKCSNCVWLGFIGDFVGKRYGKLVVKEYDVNSHAWKCKCDCGNTRLVDSGDFSHTVSCGCANIAVSGSQAENDIKEFIGIDNVVKDRTILDGKEIDLYYPDYHIGIEYNGSVFHATKNGVGINKPKLYHRDKFLLAKSKGVHLITIFDVDWETNQDKLRYYLKSLFTTSDRIYARNCKVELIDKQLANEFYNKYHLQGSSVFNAINYGLYHNNELISVMSFGKPRMGKFVDGNYELHRYCVKDGYNVLGGANKLLKAFERAYNPVMILSYSNNDWFLGGIYEMLGFINCGQSNPRYYWYYRGKELKRESCRVDKLKIKYPKEYEEAIDSNASNIEDFIMCKLGAFKVYRSGNTIWKRIYNLGGIK